MSESKSYTGEANLNLTVLPDHKSIAKAAADRIAKRLREKPDLVIGLATGATMEPVYAELVRMYEDGEAGRGEKLDFSQARFFNLDAYKGLPSTNRNSYDFQLRKLLLNKVNAQEENINLVQGINFDPDAYESKIKAAGGIDIQLLGLGGEGHIGFNEVGSSIDSRTREVELEQRTLDDNSKYFSKPGEKMPTHAYTMGIGTILEAKEILVLANNPSKAWTIRNLMEPTGQSSQDLTTLEMFQLGRLPHLNGEEGVSPEMVRSRLETFIEAMAADNNPEAKPVEELPARALHAHGNVTLLVDEEAASMTRLSHLYQRSNLDIAQVNALVDKFAPRELELTINGQQRYLLLPPGFDFFDPSVMAIDEKFDHRNPAHVEALEKVLQRTTDVSVGAHQDDVEIMAGPMLLEAASSLDKRWLSIIVTDGAASQSLLSNEFATLSPKELTDMRQREQREAAAMSFTPVIQLKYPSAAVGGHMGEGKRQEASFALGTLFSAMPNMERVFGHNPIDKHETHLATFAVQTAALRAAAPYNPKLDKVYGMEVWGGLTGIPESDLSMFVVENKDDMERIGALIGVYHSQILGQQRDYSETTLARMQGHGGYVSNPHQNKPPLGMVIGLDVSDFSKGDSGDMGQLAADLIQRVATVKARLARKHPIPDTPDLEGGFLGNLTRRAAQPRTGGIH